MIDRIPNGFDPFVIPFVVGMIFILGYCLWGVLHIYTQLPLEDRRKFLVSLVTPSTALKNIKDIFCDCLLHVKLWRRNKMLGYMHSSIAFGWFMLIVLGHIEVILFLPHRIRFFYYPIFFNYFVSESDFTIKGALLFFLMDLFLLVVLGGIALAMIKRVRSRLFGMRRTTRLSFMDHIGLYSLWAIFPLRLLAEGFTAHISGGSFLTYPLNWVARQFLGNHLNMLPTWWAYSCVLCVFMCVLPFTRYMHIPAEMLLIPMRNAGLKVRRARKGYALLEVYSCPGCGVCIDACPMSVNKANLKDCTVYLNRQIKRGNEARLEQISDKCLLCGKCTQVCQVGVEGNTMRMLERKTRTYGIDQNFARLDTSPMVRKVTQWKDSGAKAPEVLYFSGCMTALTPGISESVGKIMDAAGVSWQWMDRDGGLCCGRPMFAAGRWREARQLVLKNMEIIKGSGCSTLLLSCPICYRIFIKEYKLPGIKIVHHSQYFSSLLRSGRLDVTGTDERLAYHDPCELGRGCGVYEEPREVVRSCGCLVEAAQNRNLSICCGGSLGSLSLSFADRENITRNSLRNLCVENPDRIVTACPLCRSTLRRYSDRPVVDLSEVLYGKIKR